MSKRDLVKNAFNNKNVDRIPVSFWFHFVDQPRLHDGLIDPSIIDENIKGHEAYFKAFNPDFMKLMSDGYFAYPNPILKNLDHIDEWDKIKPLGPNHPWIEDQVRLVKALTERFSKEIMTFYNIFAPGTFFKFLFDPLQDKSGDKLLGDLIRKHPETMRHVLLVMAEDIASLTERVIKEGLTDGIYLSVQNVQHEAIDIPLYALTVGAAEKYVLDRANSVSGNNILHICGYEGSRNNFDYYKNYDAKVYNWAVHVEGISLEEGKEFFNGKAVIGGFSNDKNSLIYGGDQDQIETFAKTLKETFKSNGYMVGADCTVPSDIDIRHLIWAKEAIQK